jgi:tryptophanyl-tRNA synthetase
LWLSKPFTSLTMNCSRSCPRELPKLLRKGVTGRSSLKHPLRTLQKRSASTSTVSSTVSSNNETAHGEPQIIFSGIQPTGVPHLGNYLGALKQWKHMQDTAAPGTRLLYSVVDLHAITVPRAQKGEGNGEILRRQKRELLASLLAVGLDPKRCTLFYQSTVPAHSELQWILSCTASMGYLSRMTQWKVRCSIRLVVCFYGGPRDLTFSTEQDVPFGGYELLG